MGVLDHTWDHFASNPALATLLSCVSDGVLIADERGEVLCLNSAFRKHMGNNSAFSEAGDHPTVKQLGLDKILDMAGRTPCDALQTTAKTKSPLEQFIRIKASVIDGTTGQNLKFYCGTLDMPDGGQQLKVLISQDHSGQKFNTSVPTFGGQDFITNDREMLAIITRLEHIAQTTAPVLLMGESGTGKTQVARMIHNQSPRANKKLVEVNCAAIPDQLLESELFGHVKGAFTGATQKRMGRFQAANGGTLLLDEIGEIPLHLQAKLLRAIQDQKFEPVGSDETVTVDVRVISATNQDLRQMVNKKKFRADLFYRLAVVPIKIPPLRDRVGDIPLLLEHFCTDLTDRGYPHDVKCTSEAMRMMMDYPWPGNVREMINAVEHAYICAIDKSVVPESLPQDVRHHTQNEGRLGFPDRRQAASETDTPRAIHQSNSPLPTDGSDQAQDILRALAETGDNKSHAAKLLGIDRTTLWRRMQKLDLTK